MYFFLNYTTKVDGVKTEHNDKFRNISELRRSFLKVSSDVKSSVKGNSTVLNYFRVFEPKNYELKFDSNELNAAETYISTEYERMIQTTGTLYKLIVRGCDGSTNYKEHKVLQNSSDFMTLVDMTHLYYDKNTKVWDELSVGFNTDFDIGYGVEIYNYGKLRESYSREKFMCANENLFSMIRAKTNVYDS